MLTLKPALQSSQGRSSTWSGAKLINCFAELADGDKRSDFAVMAIPGLTEWADVGTGPIRGRIYAGGVLYVVSGTSLYSVDSAGAETLLGSVAGTDQVRMTANAVDEIALAANGTGYVWDGTTLTTPLSYSVSDVTYADGYILWTVEDADQTFISSLDDANTYDALDITTVEGSPDNIVGVINDHREIQYFGQQTTEIYYNSGNSDFPFERQGNAFIERGCFDRDSIVKIDNSVNFVGDDRIVYRLEGYNPVRISTHSIEYQLRNITYARGFTYDQEGHKFYILMTDNGTFCFDQATGAWHQRQSWQMTNWRVNGAVRAYDKMLLTDGTNGKLWEPSLDAFDEDGDIIAMDIYLPTIEAGRVRNTMAAFEVLCETGVGNGSVADPQIMLRYSDNGGRTWSNEMWRSMGAIGTYLTRAIWRKLGQFRQRQMHIRITDAVRKFVISYHADIV